MDKILEIAFSGFWSFLGMVILIAIVVNGGVNSWKYLLRMLMVTLRGWPPSHLDADGDFNHRNNDKDATEQQ